MNPAAVLPSSFVVKQSGIPIDIGTTLRSGFCSLFIFLYITVTAQTKQTESVQQVWLGYFNQTRFNNKWGLWADLHLRSKEDFVTDVSQSIIRLGLTYYLE